MRTNQRGAGRMAGTPAAALALAAALVFGCASPPLPPPEQGAFDRDDYVIGSSDMLKVMVWKNPDLSVEVPVRPDGKISVPLLNDVQAAGLTTRELKETLTKSLSEYVTAPDVTVIVSEIRSKIVYVVGEVQRPSAISLTNDMRALDAIATVGGFTPYASRGSIKILRADKDGNLVTYQFDYKAFLRGQHPESNMRLQPGDTIVVPD
jgi:polysaccharide biosynthesis/export protein